MLSLGWCGEFLFTSRPAFIYMLGVSLTYPMLSWFLCRQFLLHIPCCFLGWGVGGRGGVLLHHFYLGSFPYTSRAGFNFMWGVSLTHPMLAFLFSVGSFSYKSHAGFIFLWGRFPTYPMLTLLLYGEFLLHILCCRHFYAGSFSYTSWAGFIFMLHFLHITCWVFSSFFSSSFLIWGVSLTHPVLALFFCGEFLLHTPCLLHFYLGSFSYTSRAGFIFMRGVSLTHPMLFFFFFFAFFLLFFFFWPFNYLFFMWVVSLRHPMLALFLSGKFLLHIPCWLDFYLGSFSYTSRAGFLMWGVSLTCALEAGGCFMLGFSLTHPMDVLTISTAYKKIFLWEYLLWKRK